MWCLLFDWEIVVDDLSPSLLDNEPVDDDVSDVGVIQTLGFLLRQVFGYLTYKEAISFECVTLIMLFYVS